MISIATRNVVSLHEGSASLLLAYILIIAISDKSLTFLSGNSKGKNSKTVAFSLTQAAR